MRRAQGLFLVAVGGLATLAAAAPQQPPPPPPQQAPVFRSGVENVAIYATVLDRAGELVTNLPRDAFKVFDDGMRQDVTVFVNGQQPITATLLIDTSASMTAALDLARAAAEAFVLRLMPGDQARVGSFSDRVDVNPHFTGDRDALLRAVRNDLHIGNPTKLWDAVDQTMTALSPLGGRRVIMVLTDGVDTYSTTPVRQLLERARSDELMIYAIQIRSRVRPGVESLIVGSPRVVDDPRRRVPPEESLRRLAYQTGGSYFQLTHYDDLNATFTRVASELHQQYVLGFAPERFDGRVHDIVVRVSDPTMVVRARRNYHAPKKAQGPRPMAHMSAPEQGPGLMAQASAPKQGPVPIAHVSVPAQDPGRRIARQ